MRGRYAPSPTGGFHLGNARTALLAWLQCRAAGGTFVMRVEDLDVGRVRAGAMEQQFAELRWLGLDWDEGPDVGGGHGPYMQSERARRYEEALRVLAGAGDLYECRCTRRDIAGAASAPHADDEGPPYPGTCRARRVEPGNASLLEHARGAALRFRAPPGEVCFDDLLLGSRCTDVAAQSGDFVVRRKDGIPAYQLAVVVDDAAMEITHVLRAADLVASTARQLHLYRALGVRAPAFLHVPLVVGPDGERLAKRRGAVTLTELRDSGADPRQVIGWLASSCGLAEAGEELAPHELIPRFRVDRLPARPTVLPQGVVSGLAGTPR
ncbi:MAG TPA: tRNA glutamyl-Q(34) synthetase GluQRS [Longimicrobiaceae bacterium]|nr:tRNA glutamyl-Q(34) synthetase GluQRS [Longimicrobiaceae bacterium]